MSFSYLERGRPIIDNSLCTGCGKCVEICAEQVYSLSNSKAVAGRGEFVGCFACGQCMAVCPSEAIAVEGRGMMRGDRIELPAIERRATADQFESLLIGRRSVRQYADREVPREIVDRILAMTATAPIGIPPSNIGVLVFHGREKVRQFAADACASFKQMSKKLNPLIMGLMWLRMKKVDYEGMRDFIVPLLKYLTDGHQRGLDRFTYNAPAALLFHYGPTDDVAEVHIAATYAMLAAESLGLGSCMLGSSIAFNFDKQMKLKYGIPAENKVGLALPFGYPAVTYHGAIRRRLASVRVV
jgi:nitroreductase/NAD-dependent dihydropyrimidine dehydrogenase PreA subunit